MIGIAVVLGILYANAFEWFVHKYLLHGLGKRRGSFWSFHWHDHHQAARKSNMFDAQYVHRLFVWDSPQLKEAVSVVLAAAIHLPFWFISPAFTITLVVHSAYYYFVHRRAHLDSAWAQKHLAWHYDHHMGKDQNANWCATNPWFDLLMGTRKKYVYDPAGKVLAEQAPPAPIEAR